MSLARLKRLIGDRNPLRLLWHRSKALAAAVRAGFPARRLTVIGITGTDGKTTTVGMTTHILDASGKKVGSLSTASFQIGSKIEWNATQKTSPSPHTIQNFLKRLAAARCTHAVLEYSSHGLVQGRTDWTWPSVAAITNTTAEHLDYHKTMERYRADKGKLFGMLRGSGTKVLNRQDETASLYRRFPSKRTVTYGLTRPAHSEDGDELLWLEDVRTTHVRSSATVLNQHPDGTVERAPLTLQIPGAFNLENALCAIACALSVGIPVTAAANALTSFPGVPGRMERIDEGQAFFVFVDFTVTPASYERTLSTLKSVLNAGSRLLVLTGSCGDRMREKRPTIGKIVSEYADIAVVSNEDPYTEDPQRIIDEVWAGMDTSDIEAHRIPDRLEAIQFLLRSAKPGDIVVLCGKGSDTTMWVGYNKKIPWNEREIVRELLKERMKQG